MSNTNLSQFDSYAGYYTAHIVAGKQPEASFYREYYRMLQAYYVNNGLYDFIQSSLKQVRISDDDIKALRNPANRVVEFYGSKLWPGQLPEALEVDTENQQILDPIRQIWEWSNFSSRKQRIARWFAIFGDLFLKVNTTDDSVYFSVIHPQYVTDFKEDNRGYLTRIRLDIPDGEVMHTEIWDKQTQLLRIWRHKKGWDIAEDSLGDVDEVRTFDEMFGDNFIPFVYQTLRDDGMGRGGGSFAHVLDKIDDVNRQATRLAQMLFRHNKPLWVALAGGKDSSGRPLPAPTMPDNLSLEDEEVLSFPGAADLKALVPPINYADALAVLQDQMKELKSDLPELAYFEIREFGEVSGRAVKFMLDDAISRLMEVRGNAETAISRIDQMCITVGINNGIFKKSVGNYAKGTLKHSFKERPVLPIDNQERSQSLQQISSVPGINLLEAAKVSGYTNQEADGLFNS